MRRAVVIAVMLALVAIILAALGPLRFLPYTEAYCHWRVAQTKSIAGTPMTIDDMWWTRSSESHQSFLRVLCHWNDGFPPNDYYMRASLLNADGAEIAGMLTWYVSLPKSKFASAGVTPFLWEFRAAPPTGKDVRFRVHYASNRLVEVNGTVEPDGKGGYVDFEVPNIAVERDMSCPDIFAPGALWTLNSISDRPN